MQYKAARDRLSDNCLGFLCTTYPVTGLSYYKMSDRYKKEATSVDRKRIGIVKIFEIK